MSTSTFAAVYAAALLGQECDVVEETGERRPLPVHRWVATASRSDRALLAHCSGPTLDVGCGPGRMAEALAAAGHPVLGIDIVAEAVRQCRARGVAALRRDVHDPLPAEGRWGSVLLADGNIGIGGDPRRLLARAAELVVPGGRVVVDLAEPGAGIRTRSLSLVAAGAESREFRWAVVGADAFATLLPGTGLVLREIGCIEDRHYAVAVTRSRA